VLRWGAKASADGGNPSVSSEPQGVEPGPTGPSTARQQRWIQANIQVFDKLIALFQERSRDENRKLIAYSKQWPTLAEGVFYRLDEQSKKAVGNPSEQGKLRSLLRSLKNIHEEYKRYKDICKKFESSPEEDWEGLVAQNHEYMQAAFFEYWERSLTMAEAPEDDEEEEAQKRTERDAAMLARVAALVFALDKAAADKESLQDAGEVFNGLLEKINSLEDADREIDNLQKAGKLDPALMLTMAKAYSGVKESPYVKEEVKDIMAHLYFKAKESAARDQPPEVRILKHLLTMDDPMERNEALGMAFEPGSEGSEGRDQDLLHTTPPDLMRYVEGVLAAYETQREGDNLLGQTAKLMDPMVINRLKDLKGVISKQYM